MSHSRSSKNCVDDNSISVASDEELNGDSTIWLSKRSSKKRKVSNLRQKLRLHRLVKKQIAKYTNRFTNYPNVCPTPSKSLFTKSSGQIATNSMFHPTIYGSRPIYYQQTQIPMLGRG